MYKVAHSASRPTSMVYNNRRNVIRNEAHDKVLDQYTVDDEEPSKTKTSNHFPISPSKKNRNKTREKPPAVDREAIKAMSKAWKNFLTGPDGKPDKSIVHYRPKKELPKDFKPFNLEEFMAERLLKEIHLDPKIVNGFSKKGTAVKKHAN